MIIFLLTLLQIGIVVAIIKTRKNANLIDKVKSIFGSKAVQKGKEGIGTVARIAKEDFKEIKGTLEEKDYRMDNLGIDTAMDWDDEFYRDYSFNDVNKNKNKTRYMEVSNEPTKGYVLTQEDTGPDRQASTTYDNSIDVDDYVYQPVEEEPKGEVETNFGDELIL